MAYNMCATTRRITSHLGHCACLALFLCVTTLLVSGCGSTERTLDQELEDLQAGGSLPALNVDSSLTGIDDNVDGVRDDVGQYIDSLSDSESEKRSLRQLASAYQRSLAIDNTSTEDVQAVFEEIVAASRCVGLRYGAQLSTERRQTVRASVLNTIPRIQGYASFSARVSITAPDVAASGVNPCN